jgi:hypothetical protein
MLQGLKMKKLLLLLLPMLFACGTEEMQEIQEETFAAHEITIKRAEVCNNLDASIREDLDDVAYHKLCGTEKVCTDIETEVICDGEWCVIHRSCRMK